MNGREVGKSEVKRSRVIPEKFARIYPESRLPGSLIFVSDGGFRILCGMTDKNIS
jgi:hypothetical protein